MNRRSFETPLNPRRRPVAYGLLVGTSFVGVAWLTDPIFVHIGLGSELSRAHLIFVGTFFAVVMTWFTRNRTASTSPPDE